MNTPKLTIPLLGIFLTFIISSCNKKSDIVYKTVEEEIYLEQDASLIKEKSDEISIRIDSILKGEIDTKIISTGEQKVDLDGDGTLDIAFEIIDLRDFNDTDFPSYFDTLAARVIPLNVEILDNSTFSYCDAFDIDKKINKDGNWVSTRCVLGTFANAGNFQGKGVKYLPVRFNSDQYGWVKIECSANSNELNIYEFAYNKNGGIKAGEK